MILIDERNQALVYDFLEILKDSTLGYFTQLRIITKYLVEKWPELLTVFAGQEVLSVSKHGRDLEQHLDHFSTLVLHIVFAILMHLDPSDELEQVEVYVSVHWNSSC